MKIQEIPLKRLVPGLVIGPAAWLGPYIVASSLFLPAMIQHLDGPHKVQLMALFSTAAMIVAALANMLAGMLSDKTVSKYGQRTPWIVGGAFTFMLAMIASAMAPNIWVLLGTWMFGQVALNFIVAPMVAWLDMAPEDGKGTASSAYGGLGMALGNNGFNIFGAMLLGQFRLGFIIFGIVTFIGTLLAVLIVHEPSNIGVEITSENSPEKKQTEKKTLHEILSIFPGWKIGRDYYLALMGKLFQGVSNFAITGYLLYILTDYIGKSTGSTQTSIQLINTIMLIFGILMGFVAGPFADKFKVLKWPIGSSTIFLALGALSMFLLHNDIGIVIYAFMAGIGMGIWNSLDNLLNLEVIPDPNRVAFFLGVYNLGNTITQALAPVIAAIVISTFGYSAIFILSFVFAVIGGVLIFSIKSVKR
jgi:MFS family permease